MVYPASTYRIQFNRNFTFNDLTDQLEYFKALGIGAVYASPVFSAVPGSNHGYDVTDPLIFNEEIGTTGDFNRLSSRLKSYNIGWIQDIVPNHMAFHHENKWLTDVLKNGRHSKYGSFFDIDWEHPEYRNKVIVPFLGKTLHQSVKDHDITLSFKNHGFYIHCPGMQIPACDASVDRLKDLATDAEGICRVINSDNAIMIKFLSEQNFVLTNWKNVDSALNYRRFFTISSLICLRMEQDDVFEKYHEFIFSLVNKKKITGLRVDHVDGMLKPGEYFAKLRNQLGDDVFIVAEKILEGEEKLEKSWPIQGTSGYDFLAIINNVFTNKAFMPLLFDFYKEVCKMDASPDAFITRMKRLILNQSFKGDIDNICRLINNSGLISFSDTVTEDSLKKAVIEFLVECPVYKFYSESLPLHHDDEQAVKSIFARMRKKNPSLNDSIAAFRNIFLNPRNETTGQDRATMIFLKLMQYTGPIMAKGIEDTAMYVWSAFIAHNEVGDSMIAEGISIAAFHEKMIMRRRNHPASINATSTHDTKRGEDARARLNVISDLAGEWMTFIKKAMAHSAKLKTSINGSEVPDINEEYFIYQALLGAYPMDGRMNDDFYKRINEYFRKVLREAKIHSNWNKPNEGYENAVLEFIRNLLNDRIFFQDIFFPFFQKIRDAGIINSFSQLVLKSTLPGIPDYYQGTELWDLSFVDPDNRRHIDYPARNRRLLEIQQKFLKKPDHLFHKLYKSRKDGRLKLWMTHRLMSERALNSGVFVNADYMPLLVQGDHKENIIAFIRNYKENWYLILVPLHQASHNKNYGRDDILRLPVHAPKNWKLLWDDKEFILKQEVLLSELLVQNCPMVFKGINPATKRGSGVLLHVSSLPGKYGNGSLGTEAYDFIDYLKIRGQKFWQILPFNPPDNSFSPYSSSSVFAGNILFIDPEWLYNKRLITKLPTIMAGSGKVNYKKSYHLRTKIVDNAWHHFRNQILHRNRFQEFCFNNNFWLDDYALFTYLSRKFYNKSWLTWPAQLRNHESKALQKVIIAHKDELERLMFEQYLFYEQFKELKDYANSYGIKIIGDLSIYVNFHSADVWGHSELFNLNAKKQMKTVSGVPPDYFSRNGQLWNMPLYHWTKMKETGYLWWKRRIQNNLKVCDMLRFDHFRGFSAYWEVPSYEKTARKGKWTKGPGTAFFDEIKKEFPEMPFIAEDLGDIDEKVYALRDYYNLPGMVVLQFAFDDQMPFTIHIPHHHRLNSVVYTGTHDNNTIKGWYQENRQPQLKSRLMVYTGKKITVKNIAEVMIRLAYSSVAGICIVPMQDIMKLGEAARLNTPAKSSGNWTWQLKPGYENAELSKMLLDFSRFYGRI